MVKTSDKPTKGKSDARPSADRLRFPPSVGEVREETDGSPSFLPPGP